ncbi:MAG: response regulator [Minicystis sp.]
MLRALREEERLRDVPVIMLSARAGDEARVEGLVAGADDYLVKPFSARELTARVATHLQLAALRQSADQARREAEAANRLKDEFLAMLGHELRNPLAPIVTALYLMRLRGGSAVERERAVIERQVKHLAQLVDDLLDVSRITRGKIELRRQRVEIAEVVAKAIELSSPLLEQRRHHLTVLVPARGLAIDGDPTRLAQVISNLLANAAKYTEAGGHIEVRAERDRGGDVVLHVRDDGIGIVPEMLPRIFELFMQERQALDRSQGGLGLGLAIVRSLVALHGGSVAAHSEGRGRGSDFTVRLPALDPAIPSPSGPAPVIASNRAPVSAARRILVVDDNRDAAVLLAESLSELGHTVYVAHDGPSALRMAEEQIPEIGVLDIGLPVMDGYELARRLREQPALGRIRLIAVTGYGQQEDCRRSEEAGFDAHLVKPVPLDRLEGLLSDALRGKRRVIEPS